MSCMLYIVMETVKDAQIENGVYLKLQWTLTVHFYGGKVLLKFSYVLGIFF